MNYKLVATNFLISQFFILAFLFFAYFNWFPHSLAELFNFKSNAQLIIFINLILGPILLLIVYKKNKRSLKFDLSILLIMQSLAIIVGFYSLYQKHPNYAVFTVDRFSLLSSANTDKEKVRYKELETSIFSKTKLAYARFPDNIKEKNELIMSAMANPERDLDKRLEYFEPYSNHLHSIIEKSLKTKNLFASKNSKIKLNNFLNKNSGTKEDYLYLPLQSAKKDVVWVLDRKTVQPVGIIDIDPWL